MSERPEAKPFMAAACALAGADFTKIAEPFAASGFTVQLPAPGILRIASSAPSPQRTSCLISVGIHGDETGPIEMLAQLLEQLARTPQALAVDLMVVVGNIDAVAQGQRFIDADLNRMFRAERGDLASAREAARADAIIAATTGFFAAAGVQRWHLDLHTAIRPSLYPTFAVMPDILAEQKKSALSGWLGAAGIGAVVLNPKSAGTYSYYSAEQFGAIAATVELGRVSALGQNDAKLLAEPLAALDLLLRGALASSGKSRRPHVYKVAQEIVKLSGAFRMAFDSATKNFTCMAPGTVIATDGPTVYQVGDAEEFIVFPNPNVRVGQRAGLMVTRTECDNASGFADTA